MQLWQKKLGACFFRAIISNLSHFSEKLVLAKTSKLEINAVEIRLYTINNSLAKAKKEETAYELGN